MALALPGTGASPAAAAAGDYWIAAGDDTSKQLLAFDPAVTSWSDDAAVKWRWQATKARGFSDAELAVAAGYSDFKLRERPAGGQSFAVANGDGFAAVVSYPGGARQWAKVVPGNLHAAELLPDGNIALAASSGGWVRVYAASQGPNASAYGEYPLTQAHAVLWDPSIQRLWVTGQDPVSKAHILTALVVGGTPAAPVLREDTGRRAVLPSAWGHDVYGYAHDPDLLWVSGNSQVWLYDKRTRTFSPPPGGADRTFVKSVGNQPSGQVVETRSDSAKSPPGRCVANTWCTDTVDFYGPDTSRTRAGAVFYKARVWSPYYSVVDRTLHGTVWDRARTASGAWAATGTRIDTNPSTSEIASAVLPDGSAHVLNVVPGSGVWHRSRAADGTWSAATRIDANGSVTDVSAAALPDGTLHVQTLLPGSGIWDRVRAADGTWSTATKVDTNGELTDVAAAALPDGTLHVMMLLPGSGVWHRIRSTGGAWADAVKIDTNGALSRVAAAALPDGTLHVMMLLPGSGVWHRVRGTGGSWAAAVKADDNRDVSGVSTAALPDGTLHLNTIVPGSGVWHRVRAASGAWSAAQRVDANGSVLSVSTAGLPDGTLHLGTVPDIS
ncbi:hypothetical protein BKM31_09695 [[Actinomadura] parvosata subsp. kistnae]|uniref:Uncharacterized protein n=1 Tax=[Actinomadura] parvosata subsp. kistnae TaxID=1909395 RepID=A0A1U9ZUU6_9ACTN|nr:DUF6528 family protein [Nonomuraea sp. ATCC 55076]AQZ61707.1 hypothetical protein BKM31_09695 [Nonomuraea sp. ATCC 55076]